MKNCLITSFLSSTYSTEGGPIAFRRVLVPVSLRKPLLIFQRRGVQIRSLPRKSPPDLRNQVAWIKTIWDPSANSKELNLVIWAEPRTEARTG